MPDIGGLASDRLKSYIERIERLAEEKAALVEDIREIYIEVKSAGFDPKILRLVIAERKRIADDAAGYAEQLELFDLYKRNIADPVDEKEAA